MYGNRVRYISIDVATSLSYIMGYDKGIPVRDKWEEFINNKVIFLICIIKHII